MYRGKYKVEIGDKFNEWTVLDSELDEKYRVPCQCSCGNVSLVRINHLFSGRSKHCQNRLAHSEAKIDESMLNREFGRLKVVEFDRVEIIDNKREYFWKCECSCGNTVVMKENSLKFSNVNSCGCLRKERGKEEAEKLAYYRNEINKANVKDGTKLNSLTQKLSKNNKTGAKGVSRLKNGNYRAYIFFKGKPIHLGTFKTAEAALIARLEGEEKYFKPLLDENKESTEK